VLRLLEAPAGPCLEDFPEEEPESDVITVLACPVSFAKTADNEKGANKTLVALRREIAAMRPWYDMSVGKRQRTTVGVSRLDIAALVDFIYGFVSGTAPSNPRDDIPLAETLKLAVDDLKAYYFEGATAQPGQSGASSRVLEDWFWEETVAGRVLLDLKKVCEASPDQTLAEMGSHAIAPHGRATV
jgi:hypothetical protein